MFDLRFSKLKSAILFSLMLLSCSCFAQANSDLAFDGALGFGQWTSGGKGGEVYRVTTLEDNQKVGSLRYGIRLKKPRIIKFDVSGIIKLTSPLKIDRSNVSILGQTSPKGIALVGAPFIVSADNVILQHLRFRLGTYGYAEDALTVRNASNVIIDHCSMSWGVDETASLYNNSNFTLQNSIVANSLNKSIHPKGEHGYGGIWGGRNASFINNIIANHKSRTPRLNGHRLNSPYSAEQEYVELVNNVIFNWGNNSAYGSENGRFSLVNNYYLPGPDSKAKRMFDLSYSDKHFTPTAFIQGNIYHGEPWDNNNLLGVIVRNKNNQKIIGMQKPKLFANSPPVQNDSSLLSRPVISAKSAINKIISEQSAGAFQTASGKFYDSVDQLIYQQINRVLAGQSIPSALIDNENQHIDNLTNYQQQFSQ